MAPLPKPGTADLLFPPVVSPAVAQLLALQWQLERTQYLPPEEMRARQFVQIGALVSHIDRAVPFYGVSLRRAGLKPGVPITPDAWARVPVLTRRAVQDAGEALRARDVPGHHGRIVTAGTTGSTGTPLSVFKTELAQIYWQAFTLRQILWRGYDLRGSFAAIRHDAERAAGDPPARRLPEWGVPTNAVFGTGPGLLCDVRAPVAEQAAWLAAEAPDILLSFPSVLGALARHCLAEGLAVGSLRGLISSGEYLSEETRDACRAAFGLEVADIYSTVEAGYLSFQCEAGRHHVQAESALLEILDEAGAPCAQGAVGRGVVTPLHNFAMPLIRYDIGDHAAFGPPCPCGRTLPVLGCIAGRARDMLVLPDGGRRFAEYGNAALHRIRAVLQHQVVQVAADMVEIRLVLRRALTAEEERQVLDGARAGLGPGFTVRLAVVDAIARAPGGKFAEFRCEVG